MRADLLATVDTQHTVSLRFEDSGSAKPIDCDLKAADFAPPSCPSVRFVDIGGKADEPTFGLVDSEPAVAVQTLPSGGFTFHNTTEVKLTLESRDLQRFESRQVQMLVYLDGEEVDRRASLLTWDVFDQQSPTPQPTIDATGLFTGGGPGSGAKVRVEFTAKLQIRWPNDWPLFRSEATQWNDGAAGTKALQVFYGVFRKLPKAFQSRVKSVEIFRRNSERNLFIPYFDEIVISETQGTHECLDVKEFSPARIAHTFLHEMGHCLMARECEGALAAIVVDVLGALTVTVASIYLALPLGAVAVPICILALLWTLDLLAFGEDAMTTFCRETGWAMNDARWHAVPLLGWLFGLAGEMPPNCFYSALAEFDAFKWLYGVRNKDLEKNGAWQTSDMPSEYGSQRPWEDAADSIASYFLDGQWTTRSLLYPVQKIGHGLGRATFIEGRFTDGTSWHRPAKPGDAPSWQDIKEEEAWRYQNVALDATHLEMRPQPVTAATTSAAALSTDAANVRGDPGRSALSQQIHQINDLFGQLEDLLGGDTARLYERNRAILTLLGLDASCQTMPALLRVLEQHGTGLNILSNQDVVMQPGDFLVSHGPALWMVSKVDENGAPKVLAGKVAIRKDTAPADLVVKRDAHLYHWSPTTDIRVFAELQAATEYADIERCVCTLLSLWGEEEASGRGALTTVGRFFLHYLETSGLGDLQDPLPESPELHEAIGYLESHGSGLARPRTGQQFAVGDVVIPFHQNTLGVVTRANSGDRGIDFVAGGTYEPGLVGESASAVKMHHDVAPDEIAFFWKPSRRPRVWIEEAQGDSMSEVFTDLNAALNHLVRYSGVSTIRRAEREMRVSPDTALCILLGLLLERGATLQAEVFWKDLVFRADRRQILNLLRTYGSVRSHAPVGPGQIIRFCNGQSGTSIGVVVAVDGAGVPIRTVTCADTGDRLVLREEPLAVTDIIEAFSLSLAPRELCSSSDPMNEFYGSPSTLRGVLGRLRQSDLWEYVDVDGERLLVQYGDAAHRGKLLAVAAPGWVRSRIFAVGGREALRAAVDSLGDGLRTYSPTERVPVGAWLFTETDDLEVVVSIDPDGGPGTVLSTVQGPSFQPTLGVVAASRDRIRSYWLPSAKAHAYSQRSSDAYLDLDAEIGRLRLLAAGAGGDLRFDLMSGSRFMKPDIAAVLKSAPAYHESDSTLRTYLDGFGDGVTPATARTEALCPGDFVFLAGGGRGVVVDRDQVVFRSREDKGPRGLRSIADVGEVWHPSSRMR